MTVADVISEIRNKTIDLRPVSDLMADEISRFIVVARSSAGLGEISPVISARARSGEIAGHRLMLQTS